MLEAYLKFPQDLILHPLVTENFEQDSYFEVLSAIGGVNALKKRGILNSSEIPKDEKEELRAKLSEWESKLNKMQPLYKRIETKIIAGAAVFAALIGGAYKAYKNKKKKKDKKDKKSNNKEIINEDEENPAE